MEKISLKIIFLILFSIVAFGKSLAVEAKDVPCSSERDCIKARFDCGGMPIGCFDHKCGCVIGPETTSSPMKLDPLLCRTDSNCQNFRCILTIPGNCWKLEPGTSPRKQKLKLLQMVTVKVTAIALA
ncbi:hypothetical protein WN943_019577 [Citrus x changshan-huyou]